MEKIQLLTANKEPVAIVKIPVFDDYPAVLLWGSRVFKEGDSKKKQGELWTYVECFAYHITEVG